MIEEQLYRLPHEEQPQPVSRPNPETLKYLESLPWRPIGAEW